MFVGNAAKNNRVTISAGGVISSVTGRMGEGGGSSNNTVIIAGTGSPMEDGKLSLRLATLDQQLNDYQ